MRSPDLEASFPALHRKGYSVTSPPDDGYNCIAWAAGESSRWWEPDPYGIGYWPTRLREPTLDALIQTFEALGYGTCKSRRLERGFEKVAIYADRDQAPTHMARQLPSGKWTSKCGDVEDITHTLDGLEGEAYGTVAWIMKRPVAVVV